MTIVDSTVFSLPTFFWRLVADIWKHDAMIEWLTIFLNQSQHTQHTIFVILNNKLKIENVERNELNYDRILGKRKKQLNLIN